MEKRGGFTLIELILVVSILAIISVSAIPKFFDVFAQAEQVSRDGVLGAVRTGIAVYRANEMVTSGSGVGRYPSTLDYADIAECGYTNLCFTEVMSNGIDDQRWAKTGNTTYTHNDVTTTITYTYTQSSGEFE